MRSESFNRGIPISVSLADNLSKENIMAKPGADKKRIIRISLYAIIIAVCTSCIARILVSLISVVTNVFFYGEVSILNRGPAGNSLGWLVILVPCVGGLIVGLMALYGSQAIRGHGIPEAMEQILVNKSRIKPSITYLKPLSSAIAIGTGGPFGAEGPIIATGGALGSTIGQMLRITHTERKILLVSGATAGMSAIFGSPIAAIFLAIELLLFEFSPRSIIPVALACITGAAGHHFLFEKGPVFLMKTVVEVTGNYALIGYSIIGILVGVLSVAVTKAVYFVENCFERLPMHWMWWPAIGGLLVGSIGCWYPQTLGVGYDNITHLLSGNAPLHLIVSLFLFKFLSWALALGSGTSGGTLAPLLTIGAASGLLGGEALRYCFPALHVVPALAALVGMSAMFSGASRALLTSIVFALETTSQANALLPLLAGCTASYLISFLVMENTIMTEKIARRGVRAPASYEPDLLNRTTVKDAIPDNKILLNDQTAIAEVKEILYQRKTRDHHFVLINDRDEYKGVVSAFDILSATEDQSRPISALVSNNDGFVFADHSLSEAMERMASNNTDILPVITRGNKPSVIGVLSYQDLLKVYMRDKIVHSHKQAEISLKRRSLKMLVLGRNLIRASSH